jgi:hypothetical protein
LPSICRALELISNTAKKKKNRSLKDKQINKIDKTLAKLTKRYRKTQINKIKRLERGHQNKYQ